MVSVAFAGYNSTTGTDPHGSYTESTEKCDDCHDVHEAVGGASPGGSAVVDDSLFLSRWANGVNMTCLYCHDGSAPPAQENEPGAIFTDLAPYSTLFTPNDGYQHIRTIGTSSFTYAPDSTGAAGSYAVPGSDYLAKSFHCASCHTPHGGTAKMIIAGFSDDTTTLAAYDLLLRQPGRDSTDAADALVYGGAWCERCHNRRADSHPTLNNHPTNEETSYAATSIARSTQAFQMSPINRAITRTAPICQQCHEDVRQVDAVTGAGWPASLTAGAQTFPHEGSEKYFLVEKRDDLCTNCHIADELP